MIRPSGRSAAQIALDAWVYGANGIDPIRENVEIDGPAASFCDEMGSSHELISQATGLIAVHPEFQTF